MNIQTIVMVGDIGGGFEAIGPFESWRAAQVYADENCADGPAVCLIDLVSPFLDEQDGDEMIDE